MKNTIKLIGIIAAIAVIGLSLASCGDAALPYAGGGTAIPSFFQVTAIEPVACKQCDSATVHVMPTLTIDGNTIAITAAAASPCGAAAVVAGSLKLKTLNDDGSPITDAILVSSDGTVLTINKAVYTAAGAPAAQGLKPGLTVTYSEDADGEYLTVAGVKFEM